MSDFSTIVEWEVQALWLHKWKYLYERSDSKIKASQWDTEVRNVFIAKGKKNGFTLPTSPFP